MAMENFNELHHFVRVAQAGSFTAAARQLGLSKSALSQSLSNLEARLGVRLITRTTRSQALTEAGARMLENLAPHFAAIQSEVRALDDFRAAPAGTVRINCSELAAQWIILPALRALLAEHPQICIDLHIDNRFADIVAQGFDMGVRLGNDVGAQMIAVQISPPVRMALVATPAYLARHGRPQHVDELRKHRLIATRFGVEREDPVVWELKQGRKIVQYTPRAQCIVSQSQQHAAALSLGITWLPCLAVQAELACGDLLEVLPATAITYDPLYLYYPSRRGNSGVFRRVVDVLRYRPGN